MRVRGKEIQPNWQNIKKSGLIAAIFAVVVGSGRLVDILTNPEPTTPVGSLPEILQWFLLGLYGWIFVFILVLIALGAFAGVLFLLDIENVEDEPA